MTSGTEGFPPVAKAGIFPPENILVVPVTVNVMAGQADDFAFIVSFPQGQPYFGTGFTQPVG